MFSLSPETSSFRFLSAPALRKTDSAIEPVFACCVESAEGTMMHGDARFCSLRDSSVLVMDNRRGLGSSTISAISSKIDTLVELVFCGGETGTLTTISDVTVIAFSIEIYLKSEGRTITQRPFPFVLFCHFVDIAQDLHLRFIDVRCLFGCRQFELCYRHQ